MKKLNLGCGNDIRAGWVNLDRASLQGVDIVHNLENLPLPIQDEEFDLILAKDVLEHVEYIPLLRELHRIMKPAAELIIQVPHFTSAGNFIDPTHRKLFSFQTFDFFVINSPFCRNYYFDFAFGAVKSKKIIFMKGALIYNYIIEPLVNISDQTKRLYEITGISRLFPALNIEVILTK